MCQVEMIEWNSKTEAKDSPGVEWILAPWFSALHPEVELFFYPHEH